MKFYDGGFSRAECREEGVGVGEGCVRKPRDDMDETRHENKPMDDPLIIHLAPYTGGCY